jgi:hypothetical protein
MTPGLCVALVVSLSATSYPQVEAKKPYCPQAGDVLLFSSGGTAKKLLFAIGGSPGVTHAALVVRRCDGSLAILESPGIAYPVMLSDLPSRLHFYPGTVRVRQLQKPLTAEQAQVLCEFACAQAGKRYDTSGFFVMPFVRPTQCLGCRRPTPKEIHADTWSCTPVIVAALVHCGLIDLKKVRIRYTDPQDLKADRVIDLSHCWGPPMPWYREGEQPSCWWSQTCTGEVQWWK